MDKKKLMEKAETALLKNLDILSEQKQPYETDSAIRAIPVIVDVISQLNLQGDTFRGKPDPTALSGHAKDATL